MSGRFEFFVRRGRSRDPKYDYYPEWCIKVTGEDGVSTTVSPTFPEMHKLLRDVVVHEFRNDATRKRTKEMLKKMQTLLVSGKLMEEAQTDFKMFEIPSIYYELNCLREDHLRRLDAIIAEKARRENERQEGASA